MGGCLRGTWLPYYAGVYFEPVKARYFRLVALAGQYASISEIDILQEAPDSFAPASVNGSWRLGESSPFYNTNPTVRKRSTVTLTAKTGSLVEVGLSMVRTGKWDIQTNTGLIKCRMRRGRLYLYI